MLLIGMFDSFIVTLCSIFNPRPWVFGYILNSYLGFSIDLDYLSWEKGYFPRDLEGWGYLSLLKEKKGPLSSFFLLLGSSTVRKRPLLIELSYFFASFLSPSVKVSDPILILNFDYSFLFSVDNLFPISLGGGLMISSSSFFSALLEMVKLVGSSGMVKLNPPPVPAKAGDFMLVWLSCFLRGGFIILEEAKTG